MTLLPKVSIGEAGPVRGSRRNVRRSFPGSLAMDGFTGAVKRKTRRDGLSGETEAVKCVAMLPMKSRLDSSRKVAGPPRKRGNRELREARGTSPGQFSMRNFPER